MVTTTAVALIILALGGVFLFIVRRVLRLAIKAAFAFVLIFVVLIAAGFGWWRGWFASSQHSVTQSSPHPNANRRTTR